MRGPKALAMDSDQTPSERVHDGDLIGEFSIAWD